MPGVHALRRILNYLSAAAFRLLLLASALLRTKRSSSSACVGEFRNNKAGLQPLQSTENRSQYNGSPQQPVVDSGMLQVALAVAALGFLVYQFRKEIELPASASLLDLGLAGKLLVVGALLASTLMHSSFLDLWTLDFNKARGTLSKSGGSVFWGHLILFVILAAAAFVSAWVGFGNLGLFVLLLLLIVVPFLIGRKL